jgi:hypothetical protein
LVLLAQRETASVFWAEGRLQQKLRYLQCAQAPSSPLTGILAQAFAEPSFQSRPVGVGQIEGVIT